MRFENQNQEIKILIIEDDENNIILIREILNESDISSSNIKVASYLNIGIKYLKQCHFDLILLDLNLPDSNGLDTFVRLKDYTNDMPIVIITGLNDEKLAIRTLQMGAQDYLIKGTITKDLFIRSLRYAMERNLLMVKQRNIENALRKSENRYRKLVENLNEGILIVNDESYIAFSNRAMANMLGYQVEEVIGKYLFSFMDDESIEMYNKNIEQYKKNGSGQHESKLIRSDGTIIYIVVTISFLLDDYGKYSEVILCITDITQLKQAEIKLKNEKKLLMEKVEEQTDSLRRYNLELIEAERLKDEFLANMSHELRTPLTTILGMSEALQKKVYGSFNEKQLQCLKLINDSGNRLMNLINDILDITKINAGKLELEFGDINIQSLCQSSLLFVIQEARKKNQKIIVNIDNSITKMYGDELRLKQVLINLLNNAVKFTKNGGIIGLEVNGNINNKEIHFSVKDTGVGIRKEDFGKLFKPFTQLDSGLSKKFSGTGLGLALINKIVELHGGKIYVTSEYGKGSCFTVSLPWRTTNDSEQNYENTKSELSNRIFSTKANKKENGVTKHGQLILLIEDDESIIKLITDFLLYVNYRTIVTQDGKDVINKIKENHPDLVLMDIQLPNANGFDLIQSIRSDDSIKNIPIIALTGLAMQEDRQRCLDAGANDYISKPVKLDHLVEVIEMQLEQSLKVEIDER